MKIILHEEIFKGNKVLGITPVQVRSEDEVLKKAIPTGCKYWIVDETEIPADRTFRGAWEYDNGIKVNMDKAKEIHKECLRKIRKPLLDNLDVKYMKALEIGDVDLCKKIATEKNYLRDITKAKEIIEAQSPDDLKSFMPI